MAVVLGAMLLGRATYWVLLAIIGLGSAWELNRLAPDRKWWMFFVGVVVGLMAQFPREFAVGFVLVVWANDVCAYVTGVIFGRHKMCPRLSPNKSWEGFVGGVVGAVVVGGIVGYYLFEGRWVEWGLAAIFVALAAVCGDLAESYIKRRAGVKDSGRVFPGHGGFLDRFDAVFGAAPVAFLFLILFLR